MRRIICQPRQEGGIVHMLKKKLSVLPAALLLAASFPPEALACTTIYAGSALTEDGITVFARLEEY